MALHLAKTNVPLYLRNKRAGKVARRRKRIWQSAEALHARTEALQASFGKTSRIVEMFADGMPDANVIRKKRVRITLPASFSMIESPERTIAALSNLARQMKAQSLRSIFLDFSKLTVYDLGASGLLDVLVDELSTQARHTKRRIIWRGTYPVNPGHRRFIKALGVIRRLKIEHEYPTKDDEERLVLYDERSKHYERPLRPREADRKARVTQRLADHVNRCLSSVGRQLTDSARGRLCQYVGEIIDNAEEHSNMLDWAIQGYLDTQLSTPMCEVVIFNFGRTIAQSLEQLSPQSYTRIQTQRYIDLHESGNLFQRGWRREDLFTLIALQGNVSSKNYSATDTRGNGTVDLIEFFQVMQAECTVGSGDASANAKMVIVSGSTCVLFDGTYKMQPTTQGNRIIAFNAANDLRQRPDAAYVRQMEGVFFPGTVISLKFPLSTAESTVATTGGN